jgi:hypothetical protein
VTRTSKGFPKVPRIPTDDVVEVGRIGHIYPRRWTGHWRAFEDARYPATIVEMHERGPDEPPRAIRVRRESDGLIMFFVCSGATITWERGEHADRCEYRCWFARKREEVTVEYENDRAGAMQAQVVVTDWTFIPVGVPHGR